MSDLAVFRVSFSGDWFPTDVAREISDASVWLEGSRSGVGPSRHWALVHATGPERAIAQVREAVLGHGSFRDFASEPVRDAAGEIWRGPFYRGWSEIDWQATPDRARLSTQQRAAMRALADAAEPTELVRREVGLPRATVEAVLRELRDEDLVERHTEPFFHVEYDNDHEDWWKLSHRAWDLLGFIRPLLYH